MMVAKRRLGLRDINALQPGEQIWDGDIPGFGARRQKDAISYVVIYRTAAGRQRWHTIGRHGKLTPTEARKEARRLLGGVAGGADPAGAKQATRKAETVAELCDRYLAEAEAGRLLVRKRKKKPSTILTDRGRIAHHIKPLLGTMKITAVKPQDVIGFVAKVASGATKKRVKTKSRGLANVRGGDGTAARTTGLLGSIFSYAVRNGMCPDNPVKGVERPSSRERTRRLSDAEYQALGTALRKAEEGNIWPPAIALTRFLILSGWRRGEAVGLRWSEIDLASRTAILPDTKTGRSLRPLSHAACDVLRGCTPLKPDALVFPATRGDGLMTGFAKMWVRIAKLGNISPEITPHTLRHSFASLAGDLDYSDMTIGALLGHKGRTITSKYVHRADAVLLAAADAVAKLTLEKLGNAPSSGTVVELRRAAV